MRYTHLLLSSFFVFISCNIEKTNDVYKEDIYTINIENIPSFEEDDSLISTRSVTELYPGSNIVNLFYENGDGFGLFPNTGYQIPFFVSGLSEKSPSVSVYANGWNTDPELLYATYFPFNSSIINSNAIPFIYKGQEQEGNGTTAHLKEFFLMVSNATNAEGKTFHFNLTHAGLTLRFYLTLDNTNQDIEFPLNLTRFTILGPNADSFVNSGDYNMFASTPQFENIKTSRVASINLKNFVVTGDSPYADIFMAFAAPLPLMGEYTLILWDDQGNTYSASKSYSTTRQANSAAKLSLTLIKNNAIKTVIEQYAEEDAASGQLNTGN